MVIRPQPVIWLALLWLAGLAAPLGAETPTPLPAWMHDVHDRGVGPLRIGMSGADAELALAQRGGTLIPLATTPDASDPACHHRIVRGVGASIRLMLVADQLARIEIESTQIRTPRDVGIGSTLAQVKRRYPNVEIRERGASGRSLAVPLENGFYLWLESERDDADVQRVTRYRLGRMPEVRWLDGCP